MHFYKVKVGGGLVFFLNFPFLMRCSSQFAISFS